MKFLVQLIPFAVLLTIAPLFIAACCKLSAFILGRRVVGWKACVIFAYVILLASIGMQVFFRFLPFSIPLPLGLLTGLLAWIAVGAWFFRARVTHADGRAIGPKGGGAIAALSWLFIVLTGGLFYCLAMLARGSTTP